MIAVAICPTGKVLRDHRLLRKGSLQRFAEMERDCGSCAVLVEVVDVFLNSKCVCLLLCQPNKFGFYKTKFIGIEPKQLFYLTVFEGNGDVRHGDWAKWKDGTERIVGRERRDRVL